jgi:hypothetical protein
MISCMFASLTTQKGLGISSRYLLDGFLYFLFSFFWKDFLAEHFFLFSDVSPHFIWEIELVF